MLTAERARELFHYDPETGWLTRIGGRCRQPRRNPWIGRPNRNGSLILTADNKTYSVHRVAFLIMTGRWPTHSIDHINRDPADNRWCNLREATTSQNAMNKSRKKPTRHGFKGVVYMSGYYGCVAPGGRNIYSHRCSSAEEAARAYDNLARRYFGEFACTNEDLGLLPKLEEAA